MQNFPLVTVLNSNRSPRIMTWIHFRRRLRASVISQLFRGSLDIRVWIKNTIDSVQQISWRTSIGNHQIIPKSSWTVFASTEAQMIEVRPRSQCLVVFNLEEIMKILGLEAAEANTKWILILVIEIFNIWKRRKVSITSRTTQCPKETSPWITLLRASPRPLGIKLDTIALTPLPTQPSDSRKIGCYREIK